LREALQVAQQPKAPINRRNQDPFRGQLRGYRVGLFLIGLERIRLAGGFFVVRIEKHGQILQAFSVGVLRVSSPFLDPGSKNCDGSSMSYFVIASLFLSGH